VLLAAGFNGAEGGMRMGNPRWRRGQVPQQTRGNNSSPPTNFSSPSPHRTRRRAPPVPNPFVALLEGEEALEVRGLYPDREGATAAWGTTVEELAQAVIRYRRRGLNVYLGAHPAPGPRRRG